MTVYFGVIFFLYFLSREGSLTCLDPPVHACHHIANALGCYFFPSVVFCPPGLITRHCVTECPQPWWLGPPPPQGLSQAVVRLAARAAVPPHPDRGRGEGLLVHSPVASGPWVLTYIVASRFVRGKTQTGRAPPGRRSTLMSPQKWHPISESHPRVAGCTDANSRRQGLLGAVSEAACPCVSASASGSLWGVWCVPWWPHSPFPEPLPFLLLPSASLPASPLFPLSPPVPLIPIGFRCCVFRFTELLSTTAGLPLTHRTLPIGGLPCRSSLALSSLFRFLHTWNKVINTDLGSPADSSTSLSSESISLDCFLSSPRSCSPDFCVSVVFDGCERGEFCPAGLGGFSCS